MTVYGQSLVAADNQRDARADERERAPTSAKRVSTSQTSAFAHMVKQP